MSSHAFAVDCASEGYDFEKLVWLETNIDLNKGNLVMVTVNATEFTGIDADLADLAVYDFNGTTDKLSRKVIGTSSSMDANVVFTLQNAAGLASIGNTKYSICAVKAADTSNADVNVTFDFENFVLGTSIIGVNDFTTIVPSVDFVINDTVAKSGSQSVRVTDGSNTGSEFVLNRSLALKNGFTGKADYNAWFYPQVNNKSILNLEVDENTFVSFDASANILILGIDTGINYSAGVWYKLNVEVNPSAQDMNIRIWNAAETVIASALNQVWLNPVLEVTYGTGGADGQALRGYWDDLSFMLITDVNTFVTDTNSKFFIVKIPQNEKTLGLVTPFEINLGGIISGSFKSLTENKTFFIPTDRPGEIINIDINATGYFTRRYAVDGNTSDTSLQPYLVLQNEGFQANIFVKDSVSGLGIQGVTIQVLRVVSGTELTVVEERVTDSIGNVRVSLVTDETYTIRILLNSTLLATKIINADQTTYNFFVGTFIPDVPIVTVVSIDANFLPITNFIRWMDTNFLDFNQSISIRNAEIARIDVNITYADQNIWSDTNIDFGFAGILSQDVNALLIGDIGKGTGILKVLLTVHTTDGNTFILAKTYTFISYANMGLEQLLFFDIPQIFGETPGDGNTNPTLIFLSLFVSLMVAVGASRKISIGYSGIGFITIAFLSFFTWIGWMLPELTVLIALAFLALFLLSFRRVNE